VIKKKCVAMLLAGGQGSRLGVLTGKIAKPAVPYGGKYRIIDFPLSNCTNSGIDTVGILTQYKPLELNDYVGSGKPWDLDRLNGGVHILPPYQGQKGGDWYKGTANAIYQNLEFIERYNPQYVLILSGDHIYKMDYSKMIEQHEATGAACTISVLEVSLEEASRFGIMNTNEDGSIYEFEEKPKNPKSQLASMGIYVFTWEKLKKYLTEDNENPDSDNDFGKNVIPLMLNNGELMMVYRFSDYWKDVGTLYSLWEANMELIDDEKALDLYNNMSSFKIYTEDTKSLPQYIGPNARVTNSIINQGSIIFGEVNHSVLFTGAHIGEDSKIEDSVIMPGAIIGKNVHLKNVIVANNVVIEDGREVIGQVNDIKLITK